MGFVDEIKDAFLGPEEIVEGPSWKDRLQEAAYTPPSGVRITFDYENINYKFAHKMAAFEFPDVDGTLIQDHGVSGRRFPHRVFFWGADHDRQALVFETALAERGPGRLESPLYGEHTVIPVGDITRRDDLKTAANQTIFEVVFFSTLDVVFPTEQDDPANAALTALELLQGLLDTFNENLDKVSGELSKIAAVQEVVNDQFEEINSTINNTIDTLIAEPLDLAYETQRLVQLPGTALANISDRLSGYGNLAANLFGLSYPMPCLSLAAPAVSAHR
jgi:prophage DNA circulation protein